MEARVNQMIASGDYKILLDAVKGLRNGFVYGVKVRAPHALVMTLLFNRGPVNVMLQRIYSAAKLHGSNLAKFAFAFKLLLGLIAKASGGEQPWHSAVIGAICGAIFWGTQNGITVQVNMYVLSRIISGLMFHVMYKSGRSTLPPVAMRLYAAVIWAVMMYLVYNDPTTMQNSVQSSMTYIYKDSNKYSTWKDLLLINKEGQI
jgi:peroxisomal membrane protein 4